MCGCSAGKTKPTSSYMFSVKSSNTNQKKVTMNNTNQTVVPSYNRAVSFAKFNFSR